MRLIEKLTKIVSSNNNTMTKTHDWIILTNHTKYIINNKKIFILRFIHVFVFVDDITFNSKLSNITAYRPDDKFNVDETVNYVTEV